MTSEERTKLAKAYRQLAKEASESPPTGLCGLVGMLFENKEIEYDDYMAIKKEISRLPNVAGSSEYKWPLSGAGRNFRVVWCIKKAEELEKPVVRCFRNGDISLWVFGDDGRSRYFSLLNKENWEPLDSLEYTESQRTEITVPEARGVLANKYPGGLAEFDRIAGTTTTTSVRCFRWRGTRNLAVFTSNNEDERGVYFDTDVNRLLESDPLRYYMKYHTVNNCEEITTIEARIGLAEKCPAALAEFDRITGTTPPKVEPDPRLKAAEVLAEAGREFLDTFLDVFGAYPLSRPRHKFQKALMMFERIQLPKEDDR